jgi:hypothetical protein
MTSPPESPTLGIPVPTCTASLCERGALMRALLAPDLHSALTPAALLNAKNEDLFAQLPLVLAAVQRVGETPGQRRRFLDARAQLSSLDLFC